MACYDTEDKKRKGKESGMKRRFWKLTAFLLAGTMLFLSGCGKKENSPSGQDTGNASGGEKPAVQEEENGGEQAMGRYLEKEITLPEEMSESSYPKLYLQKMGNGDLILAEQTAGMYISSDNGETWTSKEAPWFRELRGTYLLHMALGPDGSAAVAYVPKRGEDEETEETEAEFHPVNFYADPEGNTTVLESPDGDNYIHRFCFGKDGRLYGYTISGNVYEMDAETGNARKLFGTEGMADYICFTEQYMIDLTSRGPVFYNMENEMLADEDKVLEDFIAEHVKDIGSNADSYSIVMEQGEQGDVIYFACSGGLYRHVLGGTAVEQIVDGNLSSMGDPKMFLAGLAVLPDNEFAVLYTNGKMYRYTYDPDVPTVPEKQVSVYSLNENYAIRQAVSLFQKQHPETYVRYEVGLNTGSGMTSEDAIKNLNTRIMSGSGPDLLVLDGLPRRSYEEKGVLMELSEIAAGMSGEEELFSNLVEACREDGKLWYLPIRFRLPLLVGDQESMKASEAGLKELADTMEALRRTYPEGSLLGLQTEEKVLRTLGINCSGAWTDGKTGTLDEEKLKEFLEQAKRIYQTEAEGLTEEERVIFKESFERSMDWGMAEEYFATASSAGMNVAMGSGKLGLGTVHMMEGDFNMISTLAGREEKFAYGFWNGQIQKGFIPKGMVGISAASAKKELAQSFFRFLYGREVQDVEVSTGLPMNRASFESLKENPREEGEESSLSVSTSGTDGESFSLTIQWVTEEDFGKLREMVESAEAVCTGDAAIEEVVYDIGQKALNESISVDRAVEEIAKKAAIYLAE